MPPHLDLPITAPHELDRCRGTRAADQVSRPVPRTRFTVQGDKPSRGQRGVAQVSERDPVAPREKFARLTVRDRRQMLVDDSNRRPADRPPDRHAPRQVRVRPVDKVTTCKGRVLRGAVPVNECDLGMRIQKAGDMLGAQPLPARENLLHRSQRPDAIVDERVEQRRREPGIGHACAFDHARDPIQRRDGVFDGGDRRAANERRPDLERRRVERGRRELEPGPVLPDLHEIGLIDETEHRAMRDNDALGLAGRSGGEHDVDRVIGRGIVVGKGRRVPPLLDRVHAARVRDRLARHRCNAENGLRQSEDRAEPRRRPFGVHRHIRRPASDRAEHADNQIDTPRECEQDPVTRRNTRCAKPRREPARPLLQVRITDGPLHQPDGYAIRRGQSNRRECPRDAGESRCSRTVAHPRRSPSQSRRIFVQR